MSALKAVLSMQISFSIAAREKNAKNSEQKQQDALMDALQLLFFHLHVETTQKSTH